MVPILLSKKRVHEYKRHEKCHVLQNALNRTHKDCSDIFQFKISLLKKYLQENYDIGPRFELLKTAHPSMFGPE